MVLMIDKNKQRLFNTQEKRWSAIITLIISLIIVTPLCGLLFQCGCDWPWAGLDSLCNFYKLDAEHKCPWCASMITGLLSTGTAIVAGVWVSILSLSFLTRQNPVKEVLMRMVFGLMVFVGVAFLMAMFAAQWQGYPV
jgi:small-conductance mechanosensitive channel